MQKPPRKDYRHGGRNSPRAYASIWDSHFHASDIHFDVTKQQKQKMTASRY